jgi:hypothetical protein
MTISAVKVLFEADKMWVDLSDGRSLGVPLTWFPRLAEATPTQRLDFTVSPGGLHWDALDEDISIEGLLAGRGDRTRKPDRAA